MNAEFFDAVADIEKEKGIPREYMYEKIRQAMLTAFRKDTPDCEDNVEVILDEAKKKIEMVVKKTVVERVIDPYVEISEEAAHRISKRAKVGDIVSVPVETKQFGRIAAQAAKQVIIQGLREAERGMVYDCYCSRAERLAASAPHPGEPREAGCPCRTLSEQEVQKRLRMGRRAAKKLAVTDADIAFVDAHYGLQAAELLHGRDDFLIRRSDGVFAYQLAVSVDDLDMGITRVVRARDLLDSTPRQIWLMETLGGKAPEYAHAPLLVAPDGRKLSKREGDLNMEALRQKYTPEQLTGKLAKLAGLRQTDAPVTAIELAADFSWDKVPRADIPIPPDF